MNIEGLFLLLFGIFIALFNKIVARHSASFYEKLKIPHVSERGYRIAYLVGGIVIAVIGLFKLF